MSQLRVVTWNVHGCVGVDGVESPERVAHVIRQLDPDVIGLQEMKEPSLPQLAALTGLQAIAGVTRADGLGQFGNALLTRHPVQAVLRHDFSVGKREPRGVLDVMLRRRGNGELLRVLVTHFGLAAEERRRQADLLLELVQQPGAPVLAVMGDFNEWRPFVKTLHRLDAHLGPAEGVRSFPSYLPVLRLDRIWVWPRQAMSQVRAHRSGSWAASDHLPVSALIDLTHARPGTK